MVHETFDVADVARARRIIDEMQCDVFRTDEMQCDVFRTVDFIPIYDGEEFRSNRRTSAYDSRNAQIGRRLLSEHRDALGIDYSHTERFTDATGHRTQTAFWVRQRRCPSDFVAVPD